MVTYENILNYRTLMIGMCFISNLSLTIFNEKHITLKLKLANSQLDLINEKLKINQKMEFLYLQVSPKLFGQLI